MTEPKSFFGALHGWRGLCAVMVALGHYRIVGTLDNTALIQGAWLFVDFFFVLSGFVISSVYTDRLENGEDRRAFAIARIARLWPVHLAMLAFVATFEMTKLLIEQTTGIHGLAPPFSGHTRLTALPANLLLVQSLGIIDDGVWNDPSWSISVELVAYALFVLVSGLPARWRNAAFAVGAVTGFVTIALASPHFMQVTDGIAAFRAICGFCLGCIVFACPRPRIGFGVATALEISFGACVMWFVSSASGRGTLAAPILFAVTVWLFAIEAGAISALLRARIGRRLGDLSYCIYMIHVPLAQFGYAAVAAMGWAGKVSVPDADGVLVCCNLVPTRWWLTDFGVFGYMTAVLLGAVVLRRLVEVPGQRTIKLWWGDSSTRRTW